jgi:hypothetical protein
MLDECKGERLEEVLAVFSTAVLKKVETSGEHEVAIAQKLAMENISYTGDRNVLSTLILAHKASLSRTLIAKGVSKSNYDDFANLLKLKERQIARRHEQLKVLIEENRARGTISDGEAQDLRDKVQRSWTGSNEWLEAILYGDSRYEKDELLANSFDDIWEHIEDATVGDIEDQQRKGLLEQLETRIREQKHRLEKWQSFERTLLRGGNSKPEEKSAGLGKESKGIDLGFGVHEALQLPRSPRKAEGYKPRVPLEEYSRLMEKLQADLANVGKPKKCDMTPKRNEVALRRRYLESPVLEPLVSDCRNSTSNSDPDQHSPGFEDYIIKSAFQTFPSEDDSDRTDSLPTDLPKPPKGDNDLIAPSLSTPPAPRSVSSYSTMPPPSPPSPSTSHRASDILAAVQTTSPSPAKQRHVLSLAERTRISISRVSTKTNSHLYLEDFDDIPEIPPLPQNLKPTNQNSHLPPVSSSVTAHEDLIARTRQSLSNIAAVQKSAQLERRRSLKAAARAKRASYLPAKPLETTFEGADVNADGLDRRKLIEEAQEADYEAVFKSRPKIKTSPESSPVKAWGEIGGTFEGSSSPASASTGGAY